MDDAGPRSLFVVVSYKRKAPYFSSILQLETQVNNNEHKSQFSSRNTQVVQKEFSAHFRQPQPQVALPIIWAFSHLASSTEASFTEDLYMVPDRGFRKYPTKVPLHGCIFNLRTKKCKQIRYPAACESYGDLVSLGGHIYFMTRGHWRENARHTVFERYNPLKDLWEPRKPFPVHAIDWRNGDKGNIVATAVWEDNLLLSIDRCKIWAYNDGSDEWYPVDVKHNLCYSIEGEAVVLGNTIYALTGLSHEKVLALSIEKEQQINGVLVFTCYLRSRITVPGMGQIKFQNEDACWRTKHLVHLGKDNFCLVQSCNLIGRNMYQPIQVAYMKRKGDKSMTVTNICVHWLEILQNEQFVVRLCFSLPECETTAFKEGNISIFDFNPFPAGHALKQEDNTEVLKPVQDGNVTLPKDEEGHSIYVRNLPPDATVRQLEEGLKKFGPIKRDGIQVRKNKMGKRYAFVEFESATSKHNAIKAPPIIIGGFQAEIEEKRRRGALSS